MGQNGWHQALTRVTLPTSCPVFNAKPLAWTPRVAFQVCAWGGTLCVTGTSLFLFIKSQSLASIFGGPIPEAPAKP